MLTFISKALLIKIFPAATKVSLFAIAKSFPALIAEKAECKPVTPIIPVITISHSIAAKSINA